MTPVRIEIDREACVASGVCVLTAPELFSQDPRDGRALTPAEELAPEQVDAARAAVDHCPSAALSLRGDDA